jgi:RimJ/RimL family protein N-acetyltransferase/ubiquinone/menaquinone biosynthesis C-methylase UbiE
MPEAVFETPRLIVREAQAHDAGLYVRLWTDARVMAHAGFPQGLRVSEDDLRKRIEHQPADVFDRLLVVVRREDGAVLGECELHKPDENGIAETDVKLLPEFWGNKYGVEVKNGLLDYLFTHTDCKAVQATPDVGNNASIKMQEATGGVRVGESVYEFPEEMKAFTTPVRHYIYHVYRETWQKRRQGGEMAWDKIFTTDGRVFEKAYERITEVVALLHRQVLDLGCGSGRHLVYLGGQGFEVYGSDIAPKGLSMTRQWMGEQGLQARLLLADMRQTLPFPEGALDGLVSTQVIHHALRATVLGTIAEIHRVLRVGGVVFVTVPLRSPPRLEDVPKEQIEPGTFVPLSGDEAGLPHHMFTEESLRKAFEQAGFEINELSMWGHHLGLLGIKR